MATRRLSTSAPASLSSPQEEESESIPFPDFHDGYLDSYLSSYLDSSSSDQATPSISGPSEDASVASYPEFGPSCANVVRGFPVRNDNLPFGPVSLRCFPPPDNSVYTRALNQNFSSPEGEGAEEEQEEEEDVEPPPVVPQVQRLRVLTRENGRLVMADRSENRSENQSDNQSLKFRGKGENRSSATSLGFGPGLGLGLEFKDRVGEDSDGSRRTGKSSKSQNSPESGESGESSTWDIIGTVEVMEDEVTETTETGKDGGDANTDKDGETDDEDDEDEGLFMKTTPKSQMKSGIRIVKSRGDPWDTTTTTEASGDISPTREQGEDLVDGTKTPDIQLDFCTVCMECHIPPGPAITLADRDTCGSLLPKWFPSHRVERPWDTYRRLINQIVALEEKAQEEAARDPNRPRGDGLEWHEADAAWAAAGRYSGWWRCRDDDDAPMIEQMCRVCHRQLGPGETALTVGEDVEMREERKRIVQGFIDQHDKLFGDLDGLIAVAKMHLEELGILGLAPLKPVEVEPTESSVVESTESVGEDMGEDLGADIAEAMGSDVGEVGDTGEATGEAQGADTADGPGAGTGEATEAETVETSSEDTTEPAVEADEEEPPKRSLEEIFASAIPDESDSSDSDSSSDVMPEGFISGGMGVGVGM
jgi:hypothetical protein